MAAFMTSLAPFPAHFSRSADAKVVESGRVLSFRRSTETRNVLLRATMQHWAPTMNSIPVPIPKVVIDQDCDPEATIVKLTFGNRLGTLIDTITSLKNLGLNVVRANVSLDSSGKHTTFSITKANNGRKVEDPEVLEAIRLTIINNLLHFHPESSSHLAMGLAFGAEPPKEVDVDIVTRVKIVDDVPNESLLYMETADRPGLLVDIVKWVTDINISIESGEFYTEGLLAKSKFHVSYKGKSLKRPLQQVLHNSLRYFLRRPTTEESSF